MLDDDGLTVDADDLVDPVIRTQRSKVSLLLRYSIFRFGSKGIELLFGYARFKHNVAFSWCALAYQKVLSSLSTTS